MQETLKYVRIIKHILDNDYGKERVFYDDGDWYDRHHCRNLSLDELEREVLTVLNHAEKEYEVNQKLTHKLYEVLGTEATERFLDKIL